MSTRLRQLTLEDLPFCRELVRQAGWNQIEADWSRVMALDPGGCFATEMNGHDAGTIVFTRFPADPERGFHTVAWISMVLVDRAFRGRGIGTEMFAQAVALIQPADIGTIRLDATEAGHGLYLKSGFRDEYELIRFIREKEDFRATPRIPIPRAYDMDEVAGYDVGITQTNRCPLIKSLSEQPKTFILVSRCAKNNNINGYVACRPGRLGWQTGPCLAENAGIATSLLNQAMKNLSGERLVIDIPAANQEAIRWASEHRFSEQRRFIRMYRGQKIVDHPDKIFASFGPEKG